MMETEDEYEQPTWGRSRVYFLHVPELHRIKIGCSRNVPRRRRELENAIGFSTVLLGCLNGGFKLENLIHKQFSEFRVFGREWYSDAIQLVAEELIRADREFYGVAA